MIVRCVHLLLGSVALPYLTRAFVPLASSPQSFRSLLSDGLSSRGKVTPPVSVRSAEETETGDAPRRVVFLGTPEVAARSLELLLKAAPENNFQVVAVVSNPPAPAPSPVQVKAMQNGLEVLTPLKPNEADFLEKIKALQPDLCVTAAYGGFLPQKFLDIPKYGTMNIHPSLLPKWRGAAPLQRSLEAGDEKLGVSVVRTVLKMDAGPLLRQETWENDQTTKGPDLLMNMFERGTEMLLSCLREDGWDCEGSPQDESSASKADKLTVEEAEMDFEKMSAQQVHNKVRAFSGWPGTWASFAVGEVPDLEMQRVKVVTTELPEDKPVAPEGVSPKRLVLDKKRGVLKLWCGDGSCVLLKELTPANKKAVDARSYWNGLRGRPVEWSGPIPL
uniref:Methionyl-tRNA formyltransferase, mitochondrial n=1 Tax=Chromera velia CCMP2878 TaxID=1169474 RepID=A0A0G4H9Q9_9ALVE|eukprot:Cvel_5977.t1-p1 / transcript=Cvel_5977.t1 / gene=Cvel_5977 / organism=Chromera_velia_CCMP2878 / gene_product=Methionyl-tRNA formyltransferase, putative / transcript_product=Methionyl-tRNA formyltransferase, putative / location=Cvel_scaffold286:58629-64386(+) / protein_length=388 / sequence_SO=supercontig / SO=protein_coding / is_pseudo=false